MFEARGGRRHSVTSDPLALTKDWGSRDTGSPLSSDRTIIWLCLRTHGTQHQDEDQEEADARKTETRKTVSQEKEGEMDSGLKIRQGEWMA